MSLCEGKVLDVRFVRIETVTKAELYAQLRRSAVAYGAGIAASVAWRIAGQLKGDSLKGSASPPAPPPKFFGITDDGEAPEVNCPRCGKAHEDWDGFGVLYCDRCGYCKHASRDGNGVCNYCGRAKG